MGWKSCSKSKPQRPHRLPSGKTRTGYGRPNQIPGAAWFSIALAMTCPGAAKFRTRVLGPGRIRSGSDLVLQRVAERLHPDEAVTEHAGVDAVLDPGLAGVRGPFQEQDVAP